MLPWLSSAAKDGYMEVRKPKVKISIVNERMEKMHNICEDKYSYYDFSFSQRDTVNLPDYVSDTDQGEHGKVCF